MAEWIDEWLQGLDTVMADDVSVGGCRVEPLPKFEDERGWLVPDVQEASLCTQVYHSLTHPGVARDIDTWHLHNHHTDRFVVLQGCALFAVAAFGVTQRVILSAAEPLMLYVPPKVLHCFRVVGARSCMTLNVATALYDPKDEVRIKFDTVHAEAPWKPS